MDYSLLLDTRAFNKEEIEDNSILTIDGIKESFNASGNYNDIKYYKTYLYPIV